MTVGTLERTRKPQALRAVATPSRRAVTYGSRQSSGVLTGVVVILVIVSAVIVAVRTERWADSIIVLPSSESLLTGQRHAERPLVGATPTRLDSANCDAFGDEVKALAEAIGETIGRPLECPHMDPSTGDTLQRTSTGLFIFRRQSQMPTFTDGYHRWALGKHGVVTWQGEPLDPP